MKNSHITVTDQFCGCGGSSTGVMNYAKKSKLNNGIEIKLAMNHWKLAIETHNTNFPDTDHVCTDISACDPRRYPSTNILITSPECTVHSPAGGGQAKKKMYGEQLGTSGKFAWEEAEERSRATMWDVCRFTEYHKYEIIIVENVIEARKWILFDTWLLAMVNLGYDYQIKYINSMHAHPTPQSRDRMYCIFHRKGNTAPDMNFTPEANCVKCCKNVCAYQWWKNPLKQSGKYRTQYLFKCPDCHAIVEPYFYAAFNVIDWSKPGTRIGDRKKPLSPKTIQRCEYGIEKYWDQPSFINVKFSSGIDFRVKPVAGDPLTSQVGDASIGVLNPVIVSGRYIQGIANRVKPSEGPLPVQVTDVRESLFSPPLIVPTSYGNKAKPVDEAMPSQTTRAENAIVMPFLIKNYGDDSHQTLEAGKSLGSITTADHHSIVRPPVVIDLHGTGNAKSSQEVLPGITSGGNHHGLLNPPLLDITQGQSKPRPVENELGAITTKQKQGIITEKSFDTFLSYYYGGSKIASHVTEAMGTITTTDRIAMMMDYKKPRLEDCYYRMLLPHEIQIGMAFDEDYIVLGDSKSKVKQLGNAVTPPVMEFLVSRCIESLQ